MTQMYSLILAIIVAWVSAVLQGASFGVVIGYFLKILVDAIREKKSKCNLPHA